MLNRPNREVQCEGLLQALPPEMEPICDSRGEVKDKIFVCIKGGCHDGHTDAAGVLRRGAAAIVTQKKLGLPREYVTAGKQARIRKTALFYLCDNGLDCPARFDVAEVYAAAPGDEKSVRIVYVEDAFQ